MAAQTRRLAAARGAPQAVNGVRAPDQGVVNPLGWTNRTLINTPRGVADLLASGPCLSPDSSVKPQTRRGLGRGRRPPVWCGPAGVAGGCGCCDGDAKHRRPAARADIHYLLDEHSDWSRRGAGAERETGGPGAQHRRAAGDHRGRGCWRGDCPARSRTAATGSPYACRDGHCWVAGAPLIPVSLRLPPNTHYATRQTVTGRPHIRVERNHARRW